MLYYLIGHTPRPIIEAIFAALRAIQNKFPEEKHPGKRVLYPQQDINAIISKKMGITPYSKPKIPDSAIYLELDPNLPRVDGSITIPWLDWLEQVGYVSFMRTVDPFKDGWAATLGEVIFVHLIDNSYKAGATRIDIKTILNNNEVAIYISDNGHGIQLTAQGPQAKYLNPNVPSSGIGLAHSRKLIEMLGGSISIIRNVPVAQPSAKEGSGVIIKLTLPLSSGK